MVLTPANVLMSDPAAEWLKIGAPLVLQSDLMSSQYTSPALVSDEANAAQVGAEDILRLKLEDRQGERFTLARPWWMRRDQKTAATETLDASSVSTLIPALDNLAKQLDPTAGEFSTKNTEALKLLTSAGGERNPQERTASLNKAIAADPNFGTAYNLLLQMLAQAGPSAYKDTLAEAKSHSAHFPPYERARFELLDAQLERLPLNRRTTAVEALLKVAPNDLEALSMIGSLRFLNGDANGGEEALNKAILLNPANSNLEGQLAEGLVQNKRFADAEKVLAKFDKNPAALAELATTILLEGDLKRATDTAEKFIASVPNPDYQALLRATWCELSGDRTKALALAENTKFSKPELRGMALSEAAVWRLMAKDFAGARKTAEMGMQSDNHPTALTTVSSLLVSGDLSADEWRQKVEASPMNLPMKQTILAYGFFLNGHYPEAATEWRKAYEATDGADLKVRAMLAASLDKAGNAAEAQKIKGRAVLDPRFCRRLRRGGFHPEMRRLAGLSH